MSRLTSEDRKQKIIKTAVSLFSQKGFNGVTTRELARKAHISEALLFRHFPTKENLYTEILQFKMEEAIPQILGELPSSGDLLTFLQALALRVVQQSEKDPSLLKLFLFSALEGHNLTDLFFQKRTMPLINFLEDYFQKAIESGLMKKLDPEATAFAFLAMLWGYIQTRILFRIPQVLEKNHNDWLQKYVVAFVGGILP